MTAATAQDLLRLEHVDFSYRQRHSLFRVSDYPAIRDVSFSIERGESIGIIGRNGCGKSTLLRVIAGIYQPDNGAVVRACKNISLLSLSLGFDPLMSGRENAIIAGMLQGSSRADVEARLDEIIEFAELGAFIDEPIRTYSTGMRSRLGFSVAITLRTELLLIDEVLSVGDAHFKQKAEAVMVNRINSDQTVILVSHATTQVQKLCSRVIWMEQGSVREIGDPESIIQHYEAESVSAAHKPGKPTIAS